MDAITLLKDDHKKVERLFKRFEKAGDKAYSTKRTVVDGIIEELSVHAAIEEQVFYPVARATVPGVEDIALESLEEHHIVKWVLDELDSMSPEDERFDAKVTVLMENVRHHVEEEEGDFFPKVRAELGRNALSDLGDALMAAKRVAVTHPHPAAPDTPPGNMVVGVASGIADRVSDTVSGVAQGGVNAAGDVIATVLQRKKPSARPTGNKTTRKTADRVRGSIGDAADTILEKTQEAKRKGEATVKGSSLAARQAATGAKGTARAATRGAAKTTKAVKSGAKGTVSSARKGNGATKSTAKRAMTTAGRTASEAAKRTRTQAKRASTTTGRTASKAAARTNGQAKGTKSKGASARGTNRKTSTSRGSRTAA